MARSSGTRPALPFTTALLVKVLLLGLVVALAVYGTPKLVEQREWGLLAALLVATALLLWVYLSPRRIPLKYLVPGTILLALFQVYPVLYTGYIAFTNYSTLHNLNKDQAVTRILANSEKPAPDAPRFRATPLAADAGGIALLLQDEQDQFFVGTAQSLEPIDAATGEQLRAGEPAAGYRRLGLIDVQQRQGQFLGLRVPAENGTIRLNTITTASLVEQTLRYDEASDTMVDLQTGEVYRTVEGQFVSESGRGLEPGWRVSIGVQNFVRAFTSPAIRGPFFRAFIWNWVFATLTVLMQFSLGLVLAMSLFHPRLRLKRVYRALLVIPFAMPSYLTALIWAGLLNEEFGAVNRLLNAQIPWFSDPTMAKVGILLVTMWLGFPYFFLVSTGALTSIPGELMEAASVDGATGWYSFRSVKFPLLLTSLAPLLIASFAYNFNNFNVIYLLTRGGPPIQGAQTPAGHTDILITYTYRLAFEAGKGAQFGFAAAISVIIFFMVVGISIYSFRMTRTLEQVR